MSSWSTFLHHLSAGTTGRITMPNYVVNFPFYPCLSFNWIVGVHYKKRLYLYYANVFNILWLAFSFAFIFSKLFLKHAKYFNIQWSEFQHVTKKMRRKIIITFLFPYQSFWKRKVELVSFNTFDFMITDLGIFLDTK